MAEGLEIKGHGGTPFNVIIKPGTPDGGLETRLRGKHSGYSAVLIANRGSPLIEAAEIANERSKKIVAPFTYFDEGGSWLRTRAEGGIIDDRFEVEDYVKAQDIYIAMIHEHNRRNPNSPMLLFPGWGYLAENTKFRQRCEEEGIGFMGPSYKIMRLMGDKIEAKAYAQSVGVESVAGSGELKNENDFVEKYNAFMKANPGAKVILKAKGGGGGKGIAKLTENEYSDSKLKQIYRQKKKEAEGFDEPGLYFERLVPNARHIEVQFSVDMHGNLSIWNLRDCTSQLYQQKWFEETPSQMVLSGGALEQIFEERTSKLLSGLKDAVGEDYVGVGTAEFLIDMDSSGREMPDVYFMEINPRCQVEHNVSGLLFGNKRNVLHSLFRIFEGGHVRVDGKKEKKMYDAVMQSRLYFVDPTRDFLPVPGKIGYWPDMEKIKREWDQQGQLVILSHLTHGYDEPAIHGKTDMMGLRALVTGRTHEDCAEHMFEFYRRFLERYDGPPTNAPYLMQIAQDPNFIAGKYNTVFLEKTPFNPEYMQFAKSK
ncbi:biotin carboxylase N-terminal domain-containing protein [Nanoarchaeota archaeon]